MPFSVKQKHPLPIWERVHERESTYRLTYKCINDTRIYLIRHLK